MHKMPRGKDNEHFKNMPSGKHVHELSTPLNPTLISKTGVYRGIPIFLIFDPKHRLWLHVRIASLRLF